MRIRFIYPRFQRYMEAYPELAKLPPVAGLWKYRMPPALGLQILATLTPPDVSWAITDANVDPVDYDEDADLFALSFFTPQAESANQIGDELRRRGKKVIMGGMHPSMHPADSIPHCDSVCVGEGERVWPRIVEDARRGQLAPRYQGEPTPPEEFVTPIPNLFPKLDGYDWNAQLVQVARGCPRECTYCNLPILQSQNVRFRPVARVVENVRQLGGKDFYITEDVVLMQSKAIARYADELFGALVGEQAHIFLTSSLSFRNTPQFLDLLARAGTRSLYVTTGFDPISRGIYEGEPALTRRAIEIARRIEDHGIRFFGAFGYGFDDDPPEVFDRVLDFCEKARIVTAEFFIVAPFPNTPFYKQLEAEGRLHHRRWSQYNGGHVVYRPKQMTEQQLLDGFVRSWREFYGKVDLDEALSCFQHVHPKPKPGATPAA
jgi:radical SAM superfamily enzyme YgiQ (UPF0313 family)